MTMEVMMRLKLMFEIDHEMNEIDKPQHETKTEYGNGKVKGRARESGKGDIAMRAGHTLLFRIY